MKNPRCEFENFLSKLIISFQLQKSIFQSIQIHTFNQIKNNDSLTTDNESNIDEQVFGLYVPNEQIQLDTTPHIPTEMSRVAEADY